MFRTLTPTLAIIAALIVFFLFIQPQYATLQSLKAEIASYEKAVDDYENFQSKIEAFESKRNNVSIVERDRLDMFVPRAIDSTQILVDIEALARNNFLLFGNIAVEEQSASSERGSVGKTDAVMPNIPIHADVSFDVIGTYAQFKSFLTQMEQSLSLFEVISIDVKAEEAVTFMQWAITVRTYALPAITS